MTRPNISSKVINDDAKQELISFDVIHSADGHLLHIDAIRFMASFGIIILHARGLIVAGPQFQFILNSTNSFRLFVDLFFGISGFIISYIYSKKMRTTDEYFVFLKRRIGRLLPLHWATLLLFFFIGVFVNNHFITANNASLYDNKCLLQNAFLLHSAGTCNHLSFNAPSWSISAEFIVYLFFPAILIITLRSIIVECSILSLFIIYALKDDSHFFYRTFDFGIMRALAGFAFGMIVFKYRTILGRLPFGNIPFILCVCFFLIGSVFRWPEVILLILIMGILIFAAAADVSGAKASNLRIIAALGNLTYSSYMIHQIILTFIVSVLAVKICHFSPFLQNLMTIFAIIVVWPLSYFSYCFFERPARSWIDSVNMRWN
jgi:peptidoglycan/LPS O-acetylase OafA/YrhL